MSQVAVLGLGVMGAPMARHIAAGGFTVSAWNRSPGKAEALTEFGVTPAASPADAADGADAVVIMVTDGPASDAVLFGDDGAARALAPGGCVIVCSSIPVDTAKRQAERAEAMGLAYVDAPVSGGEAGAVAGTLSIMAGGNEAAIARARPILTCFGRVTHVGPASSGQLAKLANQAIVGVTISAVAEALLLAEAGGADPKAVREALLGGFADSTILKQHGARMIEGAFTPGARADIQLKDLRTATALAGALGVDMPATALVESLYEAMCASGREGMDHSALYLALAERRQS